MMNILRYLLTAILVTIPAVVMAGPITIVSQQDTWNYNQTVPGNNFGVNPTLTYGQFTSGYTGTSTGQAAFGNTNHFTVPNYSTYWAASSTLFLRKQVNIAGSVVGNAILNIALDNGATVFINGNKVFEQNAEGFTTAPPNYSWEYPNQAVLGSYFINGLNEIAVIANDWGGGTYFDMELTATTAAVPEPGSLLLVMFAVMGLGVISIRRRTTQAA